MPRQTIKGALGTVDRLFEQVDTARKAQAMTWEQLAEGSGGSRQYLVRQIRAPAVPLGLIAHITRALNLHVPVRVSAELHLLLQPAAP